MLLESANTELVKVEDEKFDKCVITFRVRVLPLCNESKFDLSVALQFVQKILMNWKIVRNCVAVL